MSAHLDSSTELAGYLEKNDLKPQKSLFLSKKLIIDCLVLVVLASHKNDQKLNGL